MTTTNEFAMQTVELKDIRKKLPKCYANDIGSQFNLSASQVYRIAKGLVNSRTDVYIALIKLAIEEKQRLKEIAELQIELETV